MLYPRQETGAPPVDLCLVPAGTPPNGTIPNFDDPETLGPTVVSVAVVLCAISTVLTVGRLYTNMKKMHSADWFTLVACIFNIAFTGIICARKCNLNLVANVSVRDGFVWRTTGPNRRLSAESRIYRHQWDLPVCLYTPETLQLSFTQTILFTPAFFFPKAAIFLLFRQLFAINRQRRLAIDFGLLITLLTYLSNIPMAAIYSAPRAGQSWEEFMLVMDARPLGIAGITQSAVGTLIDFYIFFLPLPILLKLHLPSKRVMGLVGIFSTALLGVAASVVSLVFKIQILTSNDVAWLAALTSIASLVETNVAIIVGCMPAFASFTTNTIGGSALFKSLRSRLMGSRAVNTSRSKGSGGATGRTGEQSTPAVVSFGDHQGSRRDNYYKLSETTTIISQAAPNGHRGSVEEHEMHEHEAHSKPSSIYKEADQRV
ncbi:hypothetical protein S40285_05399 [Stachybotrys chlorohalonatus IBT 40285]|uniref:Rhodopsin domain-containing protein n=1 Tax=Stachybotrys chlorohalonatus (strain IBT 40285) TaxID=1283841 RepID=A0A084QX19_STAC4|nr:hypothetical protein S40285_05399 [Stachybotrys chlorohalonata IBT 40285]